MLLGDVVGEFTVKTQGPGVLNEDQESEMQSIKEEFTEETSLQILGRSQHQYSQWSS